MGDFNAAVAPGGLSPADYARLAEEWRNRPDNHLVSVPVDDPALAEGGGVVHQTPSGYFARLSGDPALIAAEEQATRARVETREAVESVIGEVEGPLTQEHVDQANRVIAADNERLERQAFQARVETREVVESVIGAVEGPLTQEHVDEANRVIAADNKRLERQAFQARVETREAVESVIGEVEGPLTQEHVDQANRVIAADNERLDRQIAQQEERQRQERDDVALIRGDLSQELTAEDVKRLMSSIVAIRKESEGGQVPSDPANLEAQQTRLDRVNNLDVLTIDDVKAANPGISDADAKERVVYETLLDIFTGRLEADAGSIEFHRELLRRGFNPADAAEYGKKAHDEDFTTISDLVALGGAVVGGYAASYAAGRLVPVIARGVNPRLTTGIARGAIEEVGEESGELIADVIHTAVTGGDPVAILLDPSTYAYAGGSVLFSSVAEADAPRVRPRPEAVPDGAVGAGAVHSLGGNVDPAIAAEGNRLLDRRAASRQELDKYLNDPPPEGIDSNTWNLRGQALARDVARADADLTDFRLKNPNLVVGYKSGGTLTATTATNLIAVASPDGNIRIYTLPPGEAQFVPGGTADVPSASERIAGIDSSDRVGGPNNNPDQSARGGVYDRSGGPGATLPGDGEADPRSGGPSSGTDAFAGYQSGGPVGTAPVSVSAPTIPGIEPVPTAIQSEPLPLGQAEPSGRQEEDDATETATQRRRSGGGAAPRGIATPTPQASPQATPQVSPQLSPTITPTPITQPFEQPQPLTQPLTQTQPLVQPSPLTQTQPLVQPSPLTQTLTQPLTQPQVSPSPATIAQPTVAQPTPSPRPEGEPSPQPQPEPGPIPNVPTITPSPTPTRRQTPRDEPDRDRPKSRRREIPNPAADDPNLHPNEVQFVDHNRHTVNLVTGDHTIEPLDDEQLRTASITGFGPENPQGNVHLAGSVQLEVERQHIVAESADRRKDAGDPIDYRDINFLPGQGPSRPSAQDLSRIQLQDQRNSGSAQQLEKRDINFVDREPGRSGSARKSKSSGRGGNSTGGNSGDGSKINYRPGQGPAPSRNRRSANNQDTGLMNGGGGRRGGGRRRRDEDEDERGYRRPVIQVVLEG